MSSAAPAAPTATIRVRNFSGKEVSMTVNPEKCKSVGDLVENFYAQSLVQKFFDHDQLLPPKHRLMWLKCSEEEASESEAPAMDFLTADAELQLEDLSQEGAKEGPVFQFAVQAARDWHGELDFLVGAKEVSNAATEKDIRRLIRHRLRSVEAFFDHMTLRDAQDFIFDRAYLVPPLRFATDYKDISQNPWDSFLLFLTHSLPYDEYGDGDQDYFLRGTGYDRPSWALMRTAVELPVQEWKKHAVDSLFFPLHKLDRFAYECVHDFLFAKRCERRGGWSGVEAVLKTALSVSEITTGAAAEMIAAHFAPTDRDGGTYSGWLLRNGNNASAAASPDLYVGRFSNQRSAVSLLLQYLHARSKLCAFCEAVGGLLGLATSKARCLTLTDDVARGARCNSARPAADDGVAREAAERQANKDLRRQLRRVGNTLGGQPTYAIGTLLLLDSEIRKVAPSSSHDFSRIVKELEEHAAKVKTDVVQAFEDVGLAAKFRKILPLLSATMTWDDCAAYLRREPPSERLLLGPHPHIVAATEDTEVM